MLYELDWDLNLVGVSASGDYQRHHYALEQAGALDHPFSTGDLRLLVHVLPGCEFQPSSRASIRR